MSVTIQIRRDTAANWVADNPILNQGEFGLETDTKNLKLGDGTTAWNSLGYETESIAALVALFTQRANNGSDFANAGSARANIHIPVLTPAAAVAVVNISLTAPGASCDGYSFTSGDLFLLTAQSTSSQNGLWIWTGASATLTRPTEFPTGATVKGRTIEIQNGTVYAGTNWVLTTATAGIVIDTGAQVWTEQSAPAVTLGVAALLAAGGAGYLPGATTLTSSGTYTVPTNCNHAHIIACGAGGAGGGGGTASTAANNTGGGSGGAGAAVEGIYAVTPAEVLTVTCGAVQTGGAGGAAGGHAGTAGSSGMTTVTGTGVSVSASVGGPGGGGPASATSSANAGAYGAQGGTIGTNGMPCSGAGSAATYGIGGGGALGFASGGGGSGGGATTTLGGLGGVGGTNTSYGTGAGPGGSATAAGGVGGNGTLGGGGAGGGAGAAGTGAGGAGGNGGAGYVIIVPLP